MFSLSAQGPYSRVQTFNLSETGITLSAAMIALLSDIRQITSIRSIDQYMFDPEHCNLLW